MSEVLVWNFVLEEALPVNGNVSWGDIVVTYGVGMYCESGRMCACVWRGELIEHSAPW